MAPRRCIPIPLVALACGPSAASLDECLTRALHRTSEARELSRGVADAGHIELLLSIGSPPVARSEASLRTQSGALVLAHSTCGLEQVAHAFSELRLALSTECGGEVWMEQSQELCEVIPIRNGGIGYVVDPNE